MLLVGFSIVHAKAETIALYPFEGGVLNQEVDTIPNKANPGTYDAVCKAIGEGNVPTWTNNVPFNCVFSDAMCTQIVASAPMAVRISSDVDEPPSAPFTTGGAVDLTGLATVLNTTDRYTIEWFWHPWTYYSTGNLAYIFMLTYGVTDQLWVRNSGSNGCGIHFGSAYPGVGSGMERNVPYEGDWGGMSFYKNGWQHWAVTADRTIGEYKVYYRGQLITAITNTFPRAAGGSENVRFGSGYNNSGTEPANCNRGDLSCIRVSNEILPPERFMRMGTAAFYPFKDAEAGTEVTTVTNALVARSFDGVGGYRRSPAKFSATRPGKYIWNSSARENLLCENPQSLYFADTDYNYAPWAYVDFQGLGGRLQMLLDKYNEFTFECFYRHIRFGWGGSCLMTFSPTDIWRCTWATEGVAVGDRYNTAATVTSYSTEGEDTTDDGLWHHLAVVVSSAKNDAKKNVDVYIDYAKAPNQATAVMNFTAWQFYNSWSDADFRIGSRQDADDGLTGAYAYTLSYLGYMSCLRVLPAALKPEQFMVATDTEGCPDAEPRLRWRFEDGTDGASVTTVADSATGGKWAVGALTSVGTGDHPAPVYGKERISRWIVENGVKINNVLSISCLAPAAGNASLLQTKEWYGMPSLHPESWTLEAFVKPDASAVRSGNAFIVGRGRYNPTANTYWKDFALYLQPDGKLGLAGRRVNPDAVGSGIDYDYPDLGTSIADGKWHHVAVTYDKPTRALAVWVDAAKVSEQVLASDQFDNLKGRYHFAQGFGMEAYVGSIDEVRLTGAVLSADELLKAYHTGLAIILR